jgi:hypothetical protein
MALPIRRNYIGTIWIASSFPSVAKLAIRVIDSSLSISAEVKEWGLTPVRVLELVVIPLSVQKLAVKN